MKTIIRRLRALFEKAETIADLAKEIGQLRRKLNHAETYAKQIEREGLPMTARRFALLWLAGLVLGAMLNVGASAALAGPAVRCEGAKVVIVDPNVSHETIETWRRLCVASAYQNDRRFAQTMRNRQQAREIFILSAIALMIGCAAFYFIRRYARRRV